MDPFKIKKLLGQDIPYFQDNGNTVDFGNTNGSSQTHLKPKDIHGNPVEFFKLYTLQCIKDFPAKVDDRSDLDDELTTEIIVTVGTTFQAEIKPDLTLLILGDLCWYFDFEDEPVYNVHYRIIS